MNDSKRPVSLVPPQLVIVTDVEGFIVSSQREGRTAGAHVAGSHVAGRPFDELLDPASRSRSRRAIARVAESGLPLACRLRTSEGESYDCEFTRLPTIEDRRYLAVNGWRTDDEPTTVDAKYVGVDIVGYSNDRSVEAQADIVAALNEIVHAAIARFDLAEPQRLFIPTGDGLFIALLDVLRPYDVHVRLATEILEILERYNRAQLDGSRRFELRVAVNESIDTLVTDVNGNRNVAGEGINVASRILDLADGGNVLVGERVHQRLRCHEAYTERFRTYSHTVKHGLELNVSQLVAGGRTCVNEEVPGAFATTRSAAAVTARKATAPTATARTATTKPTASHPRTAPIASRFASLRPLCDEYREDRADLPNGALLHEALANDALSNDSRSNDRFREAARSPHDLLTEALDLDTSRELCRRLLVN